MGNGHAHNAEIIYGDTDSVMVKFGPQDLATVMALGKFFIDHRKGCLLIPPYNSIRQGSGRLGDDKIYQAHQARVRESVLSLSSHQQEEICRIILDEGREI